MPPGIPELPCDLEESEVELDQATAFELSSLELLANLELGASSPFYWVAFDSIRDTTFTPGPGEATLTFNVEPRDGVVATQAVWRPEAAQVVCPEETVRVPVRVSLQTSDGALDEQIDGVLELTSANTAHLEVSFEPDELVGSFAFEQIGAPEEEWQATGLQLQADFWPGGSRGQLLPSFATVANLPPTPPASSPYPASIPPGSNIKGPTLPDHWRSVAVWPRREACDGDGRGIAAAFGPDDAIIGWSLVDVVDELEAHSDWTLSSGENNTAVRFTLQRPAGLQCVRASGRSMTFDVLGTLSADAGVGSPLENLAATSVFELSATSAQNGRALEELRWVRRDVVAAQTRTAFEAATGLTLAASDQYQQVWWSWHGNDTRESATAPWASRGELVVTSLNAEQAAEIERVMSLGGPGAGISFDNETQFPELPGDRLLEAEISR
jgi:hypothetical protein